MGIELGQLIKAILSAATPAIKNKLTRHPIVIQLLQQFHLDPEHPPANFSGIYAYALVEYGVGQPQAVLDLFREATIKQAFREAFERNDPALLLREAEDFLDWNIIGDRIRDLNINPRYEFAAFSAIFIQIANRSRTPAQTLRDQKLDSLQHSLSQLQDQLARQTTLAEARIQLAQQAQNNPALFSEPTPNPFPSFILAQQLQAWFDTLNYPLESQQVCTETRFQCILNLPARRRSYDRILVLAIDGEAETSDIQTLQQAVAHHRTDEGWLVASRRISPAARTACTQPDNCHLFCYTFDELLDETADFGPYLDWLEADIQKRRIPEHYIPLACTKEELDPISSQRLATSRYGADDGWIDGYIDRWLDDPTKEHISILGEFGTGKTWFALHSAWTALQRYRDAQQRGTARPRLPLVIPLRDYAKAVSVESLFSEFLFRQHKIGLPHYSVFEQLNRMGKLLLIFDGFDEMAARIDRQQMINNFWELAKVIVPGAKAILTCRTEHFPEAREGRQLLNAELQASTANLTGEAPQFEVLELEKFSDDQIRQALTHHASAATVQTVMDNAQLLDLARRPIMTEFILDALPDIEAGKPIDLARLYLYAVRHKMERDIKAERTFTSLADKLYFLCELSWGMLSTDRMSLNYREFPDRLRRLFGPKVQAEKDLDHWHYDMMGQTLLIRNAAGDYSPAHRSLLEFFVAYKLAAELGVLAPDCLDLARAQAALDPNVPAQDCTWSAYFRRDVDASSNIIPIPPLHRFTTEPMSRLRRTLGQAILPKAVLDLLVPLLDPADTTHDRLLDIIKATRHQTVENIGYVGGNAATLLLKANPAALENCDLSNSLILGADFTGVSLRNVNFSGGHLDKSLFPKIFSYILSIAFSPDGKLFATSEASGEIRLWSINNRKQILSCEGHPDWVRSIAFSPDGKTLASGSGDNMVKLWDAKTGKCLRTFKEHTNGVTSVIFSPDGNTLISSSRDRTIKLWDIQTGECLKSLQDHTGWVLSIAVSPDSHTLVSGSSDRTIKLWDIRTGVCSQTLIGHSSWVESVAFGLDSITVISGSNDSLLKLWNIQSGECLKTFQGHTGQILAISIHPIGGFFVSGGKDCKIYFWDIKTGNYFKILEGHYGKISSLAISPDGRTLCSSSADRSIRLWNIQTGECLDILQGYSSWINSLAISPNNKILFSGSEDTTIKLWDVGTGKYLKTLQGHRAWIASIAVSSDGRILASSSGDRTISIWNATTGELLKIFQVNDATIFSVALSSEGSTLVAGSRDTTVTVWDVDSENCKRVFRGHTDWVLSVALNPEGTIAFTSSRDSTIKLWDIQSGECIRTLRGHDSAVWAIAVSSKGDFLVSGGNDYSMKIWDVNTGQCLKTLYGHTGRISSIVISSDDKVLASASSDSIVKLWDIASGECISTLRGHDNRVLSIAINADGTTLASGGYDETIKIWDLRRGECLRTINNKPYAGMNITDVTGLVKGQKALLKALGAVEH